MTEKNELTLKAKDDKMKQLDRELKKQFAPKNIVKIYEVVKHISVNNGEKTKIIEVREYKNGVTKRRLLEVVKPKNKRKTTPKTLESLNAKDKKEKDKKESKLKESLIKKEE